MTTSATAPMNMGKVALTVHDIDAMADYYQRVIGLEQLNKSGGVVQLGAGEEVLLELRGDRNARQHSAREAGLFHTAFLLPTRSDLARWTQHAMDKQIEVQGASDHIVSEALYLTDPEGNGIEIYADRPSETWTINDGEVRMATEPLNFKELMSTLTPDPWRQAPQGTVIGHVHLQVGNLEQAESFYKTVLGFDVMAHYPGAIFLGSGGYHHHIGANIWNSRGAGERDLPSTGLSEVTVQVNAQELFDALSARSAAAGINTGKSDTALQLSDPWGTTISVVRS